MQRERRIRVEIVYARADAQTIMTLELAEGATVADAIEISRLAEQHPEVAVAEVGIFGKNAARVTVLRDGDRVEIYRPLLADPKQARRRRATPSSSRGS